MYLADLGAQVIKIEPPGGDPWSGERGALCWNRGKQLVDHDKDHLAVRRLISGADIVIVDAGATELTSAGLDAPGVEAINPEAVHVWLPAGGAIGRWSDLPPDPVLQAAVVGACWPPGGPRILAAPVVAYQQGLQGATAALAGLVGRELVGRAQGVVVSGLHALGALYVATLMDGIERTAVGGMPNYRLYADRDGRPFAFCPLAPHFFFAALEALDLMDLLVLPGFDGAYERLPLPEVAGPITERLTELFATESREHWVSLLQRAGIPSAVVATTSEWLASEIVADAGMRTTLQHPEYGPVVMPAVPISFSATPTGPLRLATAGPPQWRDRAVRSVKDHRPGHRRIWPARSLGSRFLGTGDLHRRAIRAHAAEWHGRRRREDRGNWGRPVPDGSALRASRRTEESAARSLT